MRRLWHFTWAFPGIVVVLLCCISCNRSHLDTPAVQTATVVSTTTQSAKPEWSLAEPDRVYLWDLEHHSNILVKMGFAAIAKALKEQDKEGLRSVVSTQFEGQMLDQGAETGFEDEVLVAGRSQLVEARSRSLTGDGLVAFLLAERQEFADVPNIRFDVKLILPEDRNDLNKPWTARCVLRMWGTNGPNGPRELSLVSTLRFERPTKERMSGSGWLLGCSIEQIATTQSKQFLFREAAKAYNIDNSQLFDNWKSSEKLHNTGAVYACDFNRDHCIDVLITDANRGGNALLKGLPGGGFEDVTEEMNLIAIRNSIPEVDAAFADLDGDGWEDLVYSNGDIWRNAAGVKFESPPRHTNLPAIIRDALQQGRRRFSAICVADFDRDGNMDLYMTRKGGRPTSWLEDTKSNPARNLLVRNQGNWQFADVSAASGADGGPRSVFTALWFDANNDLWPDLYVINEYGDGALCVNQADGTFREIDVDKSTNDFGSMGATCGDIDNDGNIDLYLGSMYSKAGSRVMGNLPPGVYPPDVMRKLRRLISGSEFYQNEGALNFVASGEKYQVHDVGWAWGPAMADFNNDGWLDIFATTGYMSRDRSKPDG